MIDDAMIADAAAALKSAYGIEGRLVPLHGEYDLNFAVAAGGARYVFKVMREGCDPAFVEMQAAAMERARAAGLAAAIPAIIRTRSGDVVARVPVSAGGARVGWLVAFLPGTVVAAIEPQTSALAASIGDLLARLDQALDGFEHPLLARALKWSPLESGWIAGRLDAHQDASRRRRIAAIAARFEDEILPRLKKLPFTAIYNDANDLNIFAARDADGAFRASGVIDFGDMISAPRVCDPAVAMAYAMMGPMDPIARGAALAGGYNRVAPFSEEEISLLAPLVETRLAVSLTNSALELHQRPDNPYLQVSARPAWRLLDHLEDVGEDHFSAEIRAACRAADPAATRAATRSLLARRRRIAPSNQKLFYDAPLRIVRGERHFLYDAEGADYLDVYNNVPHVGHAHPHVVAAVARQMAQVTTNTRYLQDVHVDYAERMLARMPPALSKIVFLNSASEANELALRLARAATGADDMIVMDHCYHGNTTGAMDLSPYKFNHPKSKRGKPEWVHVAPQPDIYRGAHRGEGAAALYLEDFARTLQAALSRGRGIAGFIHECAPSVGGQIFLPEGYLAAAYRMTREAGGVAIADDVQTSLGRLGRHFWGFDYQDVAPDILVLGKPIGNGFPLAAVAMTDSIADAFAEGPEFFSTFGGSSASCAAGAAVLDVLRDEELPENARLVGDRLLSGLRDMARRRALIGDVRGSGFFLGVDLVADRNARTPATKAASFVKNRMRERRILLGTEGPDDNVLKIRPPMTFDTAAADRLIAELDAALAEAPI